MSDAMTLAAPAPDRVQNCPLCGAGARWPLEFRRDAAADRLRAQRGDRRDYAWHLCRRCGNAYPSFAPDLSILSELWQQNRADADLDPVRQAAVWRFRQTISRKGARRSFATFAPLHQGPPGRMLDIACGLGETVKCFADRGWDALGVDADANVRRFHQDLGIQSRIGQIEQVPVEGKFDLIQIAHAIYFITEPRRFLDQVKQRLQPDGLFCIVLADFMANDDIGLPTYHHSFFPTGASMRYLLAASGFRVCLLRHQSGSIYIAARPGAGSLPNVHPGLIRLGYRSKRLRFALLGRPKLWLRGLARAALRMVRRAA